RLLPSRCGLQCAPRVRWRCDSEEGKYAQQDNGPANRHLRDLHVAWRSLTRWQLFLTSRLQGLQAACLIFLCSQPEPTREGVQAAKARKIVSCLPLLAIVRSRQFTTRAPWHVRILPGGAC